MANPSASTMFLNLYPGAVGEVLYWLITLGAIAGLFTTWNGFFMGFRQPAHGHGPRLPGAQGVWPSRIKTASLFPV